MATRKPKQETKATPSAKPRKGTAEHAVLHPDQGFRLAGRLLNVREYRGIEGLSLQAGIRGFLGDLYEVFGTPRETPPPAADVRDVFIRHAVTVQWLLAQSITPYPEDPEQMQAFATATSENWKWVATLDDVQLDAFLTVWWSVNQGFFMRRFRELRLAAAGKKSETPGSTPP